MKRSIAIVVLGLFATLLPPAASSAEAVGTSFPPGFPVILDHSLGTPVIGFGGRGPLRRTPVIFLHGNNDTPYPTQCNSTYGEVHALAGYMHHRGYARSELWGLGYQGDQCDLLSTPGARASEAHTATASVPELRAFVRAVLEFTGARQVDLVGHSLGVVLAREWLRQDRAYAQVRRVLAIDGANHGIISCSPHPRNIYVALGFTPDSPVCLELGADDTPFLRALNAGDETPGPTAWTVVRNADTSFVYFSRQDGPFPAVPPQDRLGRHHDFFRSAELRGARQIDLVGQAQYGAPVIGTAHNGILSSPETAAIAYEVLSAPDPPPPAVLAPRRAPSAVTLRVRRRGRTVRSSGRVVGAPCVGSVLVRVLSAGRTVSARRVRVDERCRFASSVTFRRLPRRASVLARFGGNHALRPRCSRRVAVP